MTDTSSPVASARPGETTEQPLAPVIQGQHQLAHRIVPHSHFDREWYMPREHFQIRLAEMLDEVLEVQSADPDFRYFTLDGQSVILEDYQELRPDNLDLLRERLREGRLAAGPFYVLPDPLVGQESMIRNLIIGRQVVERFGGQPMNVWYEPDTFGHIAQLPQLARGAGMASTIFWRGLGDEAAEVGAVFRWRGPDGSEIYAIRQLDGYGSACNLGRWSHTGGDKTDFPEQWEDTAVERIDEFIKQYGEQYRRSGVRDILWCNGTDHARIQPELPAILRACAERLPGHAFEITTFDRYALHIEETVDPSTLRHYEGEMFGAHDVAVLRGVNSTRMYLKQRYEASERGIITAEALSALASFQAGFRYPAEELRLAWKRLLHNAPHDSICGCSVDEVHRSMIDRYDSADYTAYRVKRYSAGALASHPAPYSYRERKEESRTLFNVLPWARTRGVAVPLPPSLQGEKRLAARVEGKPVPVQLAGDSAIIKVALPAFGAAAVTLERVDGVVEKPESADTSFAGAPARGMIENDFYEVRLRPDSTISVLDKLTGLTHKGLHYFQDEADCGDEYNFSPLESGTTWDSRGEEAHCETVQSGPLRATMLITWPRVALPRGLEDDRQTRDDELVLCPITTEVTLTAGVDRIEFRTTLHNAASDHRLRVLFPTLATTSAAHGTPVVRAEGHFAVVTRPARPQHPSGQWQEQPSPTHHTLGGMAAGQLLLMTKGLPEYEAVSACHGCAPGTDLALTLLRCVGWLSREDLTTRPGHAGPGLPTPEAQCLGTHAFEYAISFRGTGTDTEIVRAAQDYRYDFALGPSPEGALPAALAVEGEGFAFSALKGAEDGRGVILRVFNPGSAPGRISLQGEHRSVRVCRLDEAETSVTEALTEIELGPYEILTLRVE